MKKLCSPGIADVVLHSLDAAEGQGAAPSCLDGVQSAALELLRLHGRVELQLLGQLTLVAASEDDGPDALDDIAQNAHARPPSGASRALRTQFTAADARSHDACSSPSCRRPVAVSS